MVDLRESDINISILEKVLVNFAAPSDIVYHTIKSKISKDKYSSQSLAERTLGICSGKIVKYHKLLVIKRNHSGEIPKRIKEVCKDSYCGRVRLGLTYFR